MRIRIVLLALIATSLGACGVGNDAASSGGQADGTPARILSVTEVEPGLLDVRYEVGACQETLPVRVEEGDVVRLEIPVRKVPGDCRDILEVANVQVALAAALSGRTVVDGATGQPV